MYCILEIVVSSEHTFTNKYTYFCIPLPHTTPNWHHKNEKNLLNFTKSSDSVKTKTSNKL